MIEHKCKRCNSCGKRVAVKYALLYVTESPYVTVRLDDVAWYEEHTIKGEMHYCTECWDKFWENMNVK